MHKICHLTTAHRSDCIRIFHKELKTLRKVGYNVSFVVQNDKNEKMDGIQIIALPKARSRIHRMLWLTLKSLFLALGQKAHVYHFHDPELIPIGLTLKLLRKKVIYDAHEDVPRQILSKEYTAKYLRAKLSWIVEKIENYAARRFDIVIAATPFIRSRFLRLGCRSVDINNFPILSESYLPDKTWTEKEHAVCYVGGIGKIRGIYEVVEAIGQTTVHLLLAGQFSSSSERNRATGMAGWANVEELGQLTRNEVHQTLSRSMAGLVLYHPVPNHFDAQPIKMFEYMCAGIPVIASNFSLWKEIIEDNHCGICVDSLNSAAIAKAIQWIADHPDLAKSMGKNGRKVVEEKYNWEMEEKKLISLYRNLFSRASYST